MKKRFSIVARDIENNKEEVLESFEDTGWIGVDGVDETERISFEDFCSIIQQYLDRIGDE